MRKINPEKFEARRQQVREAALACFERSGFHRSSMSEICAEARMSPGNLYRYYDSKESIIEAICENERRQLTERIDAIGSRENLMGAMLEFAGEAMSTATDPEKARFSAEILAEAMRNERVGDIVRRHNAAVLSICAQAIEQAQARNQVDPNLDPRLA